MREYYSSRSLELWEELQAALQSRDHVAARVALEAVGRLAHALKLDLTMKYGHLKARFSMGAEHKLPNWEGMDPQDILADLYTTVDFEEFWAKKLEADVPAELGEARTNALKRVQAVKDYLTGFVQALRTHMMSNWPGWWTAEREREFSRFYPKG